MSARASVIRRAALVVAIAGLSVLGWTATRLWLAWGDIERVAFSPDDVRVVLESPDNPNLVSTTTTLVEDDGSGPLSPDEFAAAAHAARDEAMDVYLIIGSDERSEDVASRRADVIMMFILPTDGSTPVLVSIPRDLYLPNPCTGESTRVNVNLNGCGEFANGPELVAIAVEDFTGVPIDHFVVFTFEGFRHIVDRVGGVTICPSTAVRDEGVDPVALDLPAGCSVAGGYQALAWVRSRHTEGLIDGQWLPLATSDLVRNQRQQDLIIQALGRLAGMGDVSELTALIEQLASSFTVDEGLSLTEAVSTAWNLRSLNIAAIARPTIPVTLTIDDGGRSVLIPQATFASIVSTANPSLAQFFVDA
ncbi:MAG: LCP family protein, partial [Actinomycetota bacterium]